MNYLLSKIPRYTGLESQYEHIVYTWLQEVARAKNLVLKVKKTDTDVDRDIASATGIRAGRCDAYLFSNVTAGAEQLVALIELESTGNLPDGITQIQSYAGSLTGKRYVPASGLLSVVFDGQSLCFGTDPSKLEPIRLSDTNWEKQTEALLAHLPSGVGALNDEADLLALTQSIRNEIRGKKEFQLRAPEVMTLLASIYQESISLGQANEALQDFLPTIRAATGLQAKLAMAWSQLKSKLEAASAYDIAVLERLYDHAKAFVAQSRSSDIDLYGFFYEQLISEESKKESGEYYTPRHIMVPLVRMVISQFLHWSLDDCANKITLDPFCGSGGFLYTYASVIKRMGATDQQLKDITASSVFGCDLHDVTGAQLNMYLVGDGDLKLCQVPTSIRWANQKRESLLNQDALSFFIRLSTSNSAQSELKRNCVLDSNLRLTNSAFRELVRTLKEAAAPNVREWLNSKLTPSARASQEGQCDLVITNVPYGPITKEDSKKADLIYPGYPSRLESNALRDVIDLLRHRKTSPTGEVERKGGYAIVVVPSGVLETDENRPIRDYLVRTCHVHAVISLPKHTFAPYTTQKTYVLIIERRSVDLDVLPERLEPAFFYVSDRDGRSAGDKRFPLAQQGFHPEVGYLPLHDDFRDAYGKFDGLAYKSLIELTLLSQDTEFNQIRVTDQWTGTAWANLPGRKWGRMAPEIVGTVLLDDKEVPDTKLAVLTSIEPLPRELSLATLAQWKLSVLSKRPTGPRVSKRVVEAFEMLPSLTLAASDTSSFQLGFWPRQVVKDVKLVPEKLLAPVENPFAEVEDGCEEILVIEDFVVRLGAQFSEVDAYNCPGELPVYTASVNGPQYWVADNLPGKCIEAGPALVWSRKGAAGTLQLVERPRFYTTDVSGVIKPRQNTAHQWNLKFLQHYLAFKFKSHVSSAENNGQLNTIYVKSTAIKRIPLDAQLSWLQRTGDV